MVSACIPSLIPLFLLLIGKRRPTGNQPYGKYGKYGKYGSNSEDKQSSNKFNRMLSINDPTPLPEALEMPNRSQNALDENDDAQLVPGGKVAPGAIVITNQIDQVSVLEQVQFAPSDRHESAANMNWKIHPPLPTVTR